MVQGSHPCPGGHPGIGDEPPDGRLPYLHALTP